MSLAKIFTRQFSFKETFLFYCVLFSLYLYPIMRNNIPFRDDHVRILRGNDWDTLGRTFADYSMHILSFGSDTIINVSPLTYFINIIMCSYVLTKFVFSSLVNQSLLNLLSISFIFLSPFYIQNLSYQYDNLTMSAGMCLAIVAFYQSWATSKGMISSILLLCSATFFFQPVTGVFLCLIMVNYFMHFKDKNGLLKSLIKGGVIYITSLSIYYILFKYVFNLSGTNRSHLLKISESGTGIKESLHMFFTFCEGLLYTPFSIIVIFGLFLFIVSLFVDIKESCFSVKDIIIKIILLPCILLSIWGPFLLLEETFARPRVFVVSGVILMFIFMYNVKVLTMIQRINYGLILLMAWFCFSLMYKYANLNKEEFEYDRMLTEWISKDVNSNKLLYSKETLYINSHPDFAPGSKVILDNTPFLKFIQLPYYNWVSRYYAENRGIKNIYKELVNIDDKYDWNAICVNKKAKLIVENKYYNIYLINNPSLTEKSQEHVSVWFKRHDNLCEDKPNITFIRNLFLHE